MEPVKFWKKERLGLLMIAASLAVIMLTCGLLVAHSRNERLAHIGQQGAAVTRLLAELPLEELVPSRGQRGLVHALAAALRDTSLAYVVVVNPTGAPLLAVSSPGAIAPAAAMPSDPSLLLEEVNLDLHGQPVIEFRAPIYVAGELAAYLRLGYCAPSFRVPREYLPFLATIALLIFLLTPSFYFLLRREIKPLARLRTDLAVEPGGAAVRPYEPENSYALEDVLETFTQFVQQARRRIEDLEESSGNLMTSSKLIGYQRSRIETIIQSLPDGILVLDETGVAALANHRLGSLVGVDPAAMLGRRPSAWIVEEGLLAYLGKCQARGSRGFLNESLEYAPANAPEKAVAVSAYPLGGQNVDSGALGGTLFVFRDATLESLARSARGEFVAHVAHELKSPLNVLRMYSEELLNTDELTDELRVEAVNVIYDEVDRLSTLIGNLLSLTKIEMGSLSIDRQRVKLNELLEDALHTVSRGGLDADLRFHLRLPRELSRVAVDKDLLRVAVNNLLTNAIKYNRPGGEVTLAAEESDEAIRITVQDTGIGIDERDMGRLFEKFFRSDSEAVRQKGGHGLGLALARQIVELHNGTLAVASVLGEGSEFTIELRKEPGLVKQAI